MRKFMCTHTLPGGTMTLDQVCQIADAAQQDPDVRGYRSFINLTEGKACCVLEAEDREKLSSWFQKMGLPYDSIVPVEFEGDRGAIDDVRQPAMAGVA